MRLRVLLVALWIGRAGDLERRLYATFLQQILHSFGGMWGRHRAWRIDGFVDFFHTAIEILIIFILVVEMLHFLFKLFTTLFRRISSVVHVVIAWLQFIPHMFTVKITIAGACKQNHT